MKPGDSFVITISGGSPNTSVDSGMQIGSNRTDSDWVNDAVSGSFDKDGIMTISYTVPQNFKDYMEFQDWSGKIDWSTTSISIERATQVQDSNLVSSQVQSAQKAPTYKTGMGLSLSSFTRNLDSITEVKKVDNLVAGVTLTGVEIDDITTATFESNGYEYFEISYSDIIGSNHFVRSIPNLLASDGTNSYYYTVEEILIGKDKPGEADYAVEYRFTDTDDQTWHSVNASKGNAAVLIRNTKLADTPVELPTSGGSGTKIYYTIGGILLLLSAAGYVTAKRRRWSDG